MKSNCTLIAPFRILSTRITDFLFLDYFPCSPPLSFCYNLISPPLLSSALRFGYHRLGTFGTNKTLPFYPIFFFLLLISKIFSPLNWNPLAMIIQLKTRYLSHPPNSPARWVFPLCYVYAKKTASTSGVWIFLIYGLSGYASIFSYSLSSCSLFTASYPAFSALPPLCSSFSDLTPFARWMISETKGEERRGGDLRSLLVY